MCPGPCGLPTEETMHPSAEGTFGVRMFVCHACAEIERFKNALADSTVEPGARISVTKS